MLPKGASFLAAQDRFFELAEGEDPVFDYLADKPDIQRLVCIVHGDRVNLIYKGAAVNI